MTILNLTQHDATPDQIAAGVVEPDQSTKEYIKYCLTFEYIPPEDGILLRQRAMFLAETAARSGHDKAMIGGAPYLMGLLSIHLQARGITPIHAFTIRETMERTQPDGSVKKEAIFRHLGFVTDPIRLG